MASTTKYGEWPKAAEVAKPADVILQQHSPKTEEVPMDPTREDIRQTLGKLCARVELLQTEQSEIKSTLREVRDKVIGSQTCPSPGLCVLLQQQGQDREARLRSLERRDAYILGACAVISLTIPFLLKLLKF